MQKINTEIIASYSQNSMNNIFLCCQTHISSERAGHDVGE